jgi:hypothetical protein
MRIGGLWLALISYMWLSKRFIFEILIYPNIVVIVTLILHLFEAFLTGILG